MKRNFKKILVLIVVSLALWGCGQAKKSTEGPVKLTLWHEVEPKVAAAIQSELTKLEPNIVVDVVRKDNSSGALKLVAGDPQSAPDLYFGPHDKIGLFATIGLLKSMDELVKKKQSQYIPMTIEAGKFQGHYYQVPVYFETLLFMYNKDLLSKVPETTDDLLAMMKEQTTGGMFGFVEQHSTAYYVAAWINAFGGYIINENSEPGLNLPQTIRAIEYHKQFVQYMPKDGEWNTVITLFNEGKAASTSNGPWIVGGAREKGIKLGFAPLPIASPVNKRLSPYAGVQGFMAIAKDEHSDAVNTVLTFLLSKDLGEALALSTGSAPANIKAYDNPTVQNDELIQAMKKAGQGATPMPNVPEMDVMWSVTENALAAINKKDADAKTELDKAQAAAIRGIEDMK